MNFLGVCLEKMDLLAEAEMLYELLRTGRMGVRSFLQNAANLGARNMVGADYLLFLLGQASYGRPLDPRSPEHV